MGNQWQDLHAQRNKTVQERFWEKVDKSGDCWNWLGSRIQQGYGMFIFNGKSQPAHRVVLMLDGIDIPDDMYVCHTCDNPPCVNPDHLWVGTPSDNMNDMVRKGRHFQPDNSGSKQHQAKLHETDIPRIKDMRRCGALQKDIAAWFGVSRKTIGNVLNGVSWNHVN